MSTTFAIAPALRRQPLAPLRRRTLQEARLNTLNKLGATLLSTPLKRSFSYDSDGENVTPVMKQDATKRKRAADDDGQLSESPKALKASRISLVTADNKTPEVSTPRKVNLPMAKPAGRSPQANAKLGKAFGRRSLRTSVASNAASHIKSKPAPLSTVSRKVTQPASWSFNIHVDTADEEATNTMQHFAGRLDISDDESKAKFDDRGKENIPPHELGISMPTAAQPAALASRKNMIAQSRSPLGELKAADYYGPFLHALSYAVIHDNESLKTTPEILNTPVILEPAARPKSLSLAVVPEVDERAPQAVDMAASA